MAFKFKQKCVRCKKNYVVTTSRNAYPVCYECEKSELGGKITEPEMKELFNIPEEYYIENSFLRSIKISYLKYGKLSEKQIEAFKKAVEKIAKEKK